MSLKKTINLILCAYDCADTIDAVLKPWLEVKNKGDYNINIGVCSVQFFEYKNLGYKNTNEETIEKLKSIKEIEYIYSDDDVVGDVSESTARNKIFLQMPANADYLWLLDSDEFYSVEQIEKTLSFIEKDPFISWYSIEFKNVVFDKTKYVQGFCPPRIFKYNIDNALRLSKIYYDNDVYYSNIFSNGKVDYKSLSTKKVPLSIVNPIHITWTHENGKAKVDYQLKHFGHCSYRFNNVANKLEFDLDFHKKYGIPVPELHNLSQEDLTFIKNLV